jgi:hypothetical protein
MCANRGLVRGDHDDQATVTHFDRFATPGEATASGNQLMGPWRQLDGLGNRLSQVMRASVNGGPHAGEAGAHRSKGRQKTASGSPRSRDDLLEKGHSRHGRSLTVATQAHNDGCTNLKASPYAGSGRAPGSRLHIGQQSLRQVSDCCRTHLVAGGNSGTRLASGLVIACLCAAPAAITGCSSSTTAKAISAKPKFGAAQFSLTGQISMTWIANDSCVVTAGDVTTPLAPQADNEYVTISLQDFSAPGILTVQVPTHGGSFSLPNSQASVAIQLIHGNKTWNAQSRPRQAEQGPSVEKFGSGTVTAARNARSGSLNVTLKPTDLDIPEVRPSSDDVHMVGRWSGCPRPLSSSTPG